MCKLTRESHYTGHCNVVKILYKDVFDKCSILEQEVYKRYQFTRDRSYSGLICDRTISENSTMIPHQLA